VADTKDKTADIIIIGGGIMGLCLAYYLARMGRPKILLFEKALLAQASTGLSVGGIRLQFSHPTNIRLSQMSLEVFENIKEELGPDAEISFRQEGYLFLTREEALWREFQAALLLQHRLGVPSEALSPGEIGRRWPYLNTEDLKGGTFCGRDGYADPYLTAMAFAREARRLGVKILEKTSVTAVLTEGGRVSGVLSGRNVHSAPVVVNCAGPWAAEVGEMAGIRLPVKPVRRQVFMTKTLPNLPRPIPLIIDYDTLFYFRGEEPGVLMGMSDPEEPPSFNTQVDRSFLERVVARALQLAPPLAEAEILRGWGGLYAVSPDENPIIGQSQDLQGFYCSVGFSGHGFQHGPAVGRLLAQLILNGQTDLDLWPFRFDRFDQRGEGEKRVV
jgi:sarcosine oxidase subunit beta